MMANGAHRQDGPPDAVRSDTLPWRPLGPPRTGVMGRELSRDPTTGAHTGVMRYPPGFLAERRHWFDADEEIFVVGGTLTVNGVTYDAGDYAYFPAGLARDRIASDGGADVLTFFERADRVHVGTPPAEAFDPRRLILHLRSDDLPWRADGSVEPGVEVRRLRDDSDGMTWLARCETGATVAAVPARAIEAFVLAGSVDAAGAILQPGSYLWRPPGRAEPYRAAPGSLLVFRSKLGRRVLAPD